MKNNTLRSVGAIVAGFLVIAALSHATDYILEKNGLLLLPFRDNPISVVLLVILYRNIYNVTGCYIAAALAPKNAMKHAWILGSFGIVLSLLGTIVMWDEGVHWYPVSLIVLALPCAWLGGTLNNLLSRPSKQLI